jgi:hypothetical protein
MSANGTFTEKPTLATAATSYDCAGKTIIVTSALTAVQSNISSASVNSWPTDRTLEVKPGGSIHPTTKFIGLNNVTPEMFGAVADAKTDGTGTDSTVALQAAFNSVAPVKLNGYYLFSNLTLPNIATVRGTGIHMSGLIAKTGSTGIAIQNSGNAEKITLEDFAIYLRNQSYTGGLNLGLSGGDTVFGTEALINNIWVRDLPTGVPGININGNVGHFGRLLAQNKGGINIVGSGNMINKVESMQSSGFVDTSMYVAGTGMVNVAGTGTTRTATV